MGLFSSCNVGPVITQDVLWPLNGKTETEIKGDIKTYRGFEVYEMTETYDIRKKYM